MSGKEEKTSGSDSYEERERERDGNEGDLVRDCHVQVTQRNAILQHMHHHS